MIPKFRAWDKETKTMYEVKSIIYTLGGMLCVNREALFPERTLYFEDTPVMQSTGGNDKYDEEIFEGDIVGEKDDASTYGVVTYDPNRLMFRVYGKYFDDALSDYWDCEIIGNIYENPELMEVINE